jgi:hypothetical protein
MSVFLAVRSRAIAARPGPSMKSSLRDPLQLGEWRKCHSDEYLPSDFGKQSTTPNFSAFSEFAAYFVSCK